MSKKLSSDKDARQALMKSLQSVFGLSPTPQPPAKIWSDSEFREALYELGNPRRRKLQEPRPS